MMNSEHLSFRLRSAILAEILTDEELNPWVDVAIGCLPLLVESDIEVFLLNAFSQRKDKVEPLLAALAAYQPVSWTGILGVTRALLWLGVMKYVEANHSLIHEVFDRVSSGWHLVLDFDIVQATPGYRQTMWRNLSGLISEEGQRQIKSYQDRQTEKSQVNIYAAEWLSFRNQSPLRPATESDWADVAEMLFWLGHCAVAWELTKCLSHVQASDASNNNCLSTVNFANGYRVISRVQNEFRGLLGHYVDDVALGELDCEEMVTLMRVWSMWYHFAFCPDLVLQNAEQQCLARLFDVLQNTRQRLQESLDSLPSSVRAKVISESVTWDDEPTLWISLDGENAAGVYSSFVDTVSIIRQVMPSSDVTMLEHYVYDFSWRYIAIVPLHRGKSLDGQAWHIYLPILQDGDMDRWWNYMRQNIPSQALTALQIGVWSIPRLVAGANLYRSAASLFLMLAHIRDLGRLPKMDDPGFKLCQSYVTQAAVTIQEFCQSCLNCSSEMFAYYNEMSPTAIVERPYLTASINELLNLAGQLAPGPGFSDEVVLQYDELVSWADKLEEGYRLAFLAYLHWASDVTYENPDSSR